jgi:hypothetical protein
MIHLLILSRADTRILVEKGCAKGGLVLIGRPGGAPVDNSDCEL